MVRFRLLNQSKAIGKDVSEKQDQTNTYAYLALLSFIAAWLATFSNFSFFNCVLSAKLLHLFFEVAHLHNLNIETWTQWTLQFNIYMSHIYKPIQLC